MTLTALCELMGIQPHNYVNRFCNDAIRARVDEMEAPAHKAVLVATNTNEGKIMRTHQESLAGIEQCIRKAWNALNEAQRHDTRMSEGYLDQELADRQLTSYVMLIERDLGTAFADAKELRQRLAETQRGHE